MTTPTTLEPLECRRLLALTVTADAVAQGLEITDFASHFPAQPLGMAFPDSGGIMVSDAAGDLRRFPDTHGRDASLVDPDQSYPSLLTMDMAQVDGAIYLAQPGFGQIVQLNDNGSLNRIIASDLGLLVGLAANPVNGHIFASTQGDDAVVWEVDPVTGAAAVFANASMHDLAVSADGGVLYGTATAGDVFGFDTTTGNQVFDSGPIDGDPMGIVVGTGALGGNLLVSTSSGTLVEISLSDSSQTVLADGGTGGSFAAADPRDGSVLFTQGDSIQRLRTSPASDRFVTATGATISATATREFSGAVASFTDTESVPIDAYTAVIDWGDGTTSEGTVVANASGGFDVVGTHTYAGVASGLTTSIEISDPDGAIATATGIADVNQPTLGAPQGRDISTTEGQQFSGTVGSFDDQTPGGHSNYHVIIDWGDSFSSAGTVSANPDGTGFIVTGTHTYAMAGGYPVNVQVIRTPGNEQLTIQSNAFVEDAELTDVAGRNIRTPVGRTFNGTIASFHDNNPLETGNSFNLLIDWGDGETSQGTIVNDGNGNFHVVGTHAYSAVGTYTVQTLIADTGGSESVATGRAVVTFRAATGFGNGSRLGARVESVLSRLRDLLTSQFQ